MRALNTSVISILLIAAPLAVEAAAAEEKSVHVYVKVKGSETGVWSDIYLRKKTERYKFDETDREGNWQRELKCESAMFIYASPKEWVYTASQEKPCRQGSIPLEVERKYYVSVLKKSFDIEALKKVSGNAELGKLPDSLAMALKADDAAAVAQISTEIHARLQLRPGLIDPEPYRVLALDAGLKAIGGGHALTRNTHSERLNLSNSAVSQIMSLQADKGLKKTGALDWNTLSTMSGRDLGQIYRFTYEPSKY